LRAPIHGFAGKGSDHLQLIKFLPSRAPGKGVCGWAKIFGSALLQPARSVCVSSAHFFHWELKSIIISEGLKSIKEIQLINSLIVFSYTSIMFEDSSDTINVWQINGTPNAFFSFPLFNLVPAMYEYRGLLF